MKLGEVSKPYDTIGGKYGYGRKEDVANAMLAAVLSKHPSAKILSYEDVDLCKFWWNMVKLTYIYDETNERESVQE